MLTMFLLEEEVLAHMSVSARIGKGDGAARHLGDELQGSGLVVELTRFGSIMDIFSSVVGLSQVCLSGTFPKVK